MKQIKKSLALLLALAMCLSFLAVSASAATVEELFEGLEGKLVVIHTNDVHGRDVAGGSVYGTAAVAQLKKDLEAAGAEVLLLSAGDAMQGLPLVNYDFGATAIEFLTAAGYDAMTPGNHEFDWGIANLLDVLEGAGFTTLSANILYTDENELGGEAGTLVFDANKIFELGEFKVGVFGLTTPETFTKAHPAKVKGIEFLQGEDMFAAAQEQVDFLLAEGCNFIIALGHLGIDDESKGNRSIDLIEAVTGIDLFVDGHSHTVLPNGRQEGDTLLVSAGTALANIGVVVFDPADESLAARLLGIVDGEKAYTGIDEELAAVINARNKLVTDTLKGEVIGATEVLLYGKNTVDPPGVRVAETNLGDFATDALLWLARREYGEDFVDAALTNGGGIRDSIPNDSEAEFPYEITMLDMVTVFPFGNQVEVVEITGAQLLEALEAATFSNPGAVGAFPQVSGIEFKIYNFIPYAQGAQYPSSTYFAPANPGSRIRDVKVGGEPLDLEQVYRVATNDFTAAGGDTYLVFKDKLASYSTGVAMEQALIDFLAEELEGVVGEEYAKPQGRITIFGNGAFTDIDPGAWYMDALTYAVVNGIVSGTSATTFEPETLVNVASAFMILHNYEKKPAAFGANFDDVGAEDWYAAAALWAKQTGLSIGDGAGVFNGMRNITRAELATIFARYLEMYGYELEAADISGFDDVGDIPAWAADEGVLDKMVGAGLMQGNNNMLSPNATARRCELAVLLVNLIKFMEANDNAEQAQGLVAELIYGGNLSLGISGATLFNAGFAIGDIITVTVGDFVLDMPLCMNYNDVDVMDNLIRLGRGDRGSAVIVAVNMSTFALKYGGDVGDMVTFTMKEQGGYLEELGNRPTEEGRTNNREDYASDEIFANFREISLGDIAPGVLYRSSSPVNNVNGRAAYADKLTAAAGIATIMNIADSEAEVLAFFETEDFDSPYYKSLFEDGQVIALKMGVDFFFNEPNRDLFRQGLEFIIDNEGPYLIHCTEGKDRVGFTFAMLEALMGATIDEIVADYMLTYVNYVNFEIGSDDYLKFASFAILPQMCLMAGVEKGTDLSGVDLVEAANEFLLGIGLDQGQIDKLVAILSGSEALAAAA